MSRTRTGRVGRQGTQPGQRETPSDVPDGRGHGIAAFGELLCFVVVCGYPEKKDESITLCDGCGRHSGLRLHAVSEAVRTGGYALSLAVGCNSTHKRVGDRSIRKPFSVGAIHRGSVHIHLLGRSTIHSNYPVSVSLFKGKLSKSMQ